MWIQHTKQTLIIFKIHLGFERDVVYNTAVILAMSYMGGVHCVTHEKMNVQ